MRRRELFYLPLGLLIPVGLAGCSGEPKAGPVEVKWDRDACERCRMVLSDRAHAAEVRQPLADGRSKVHLFDDVGCAVIWLRDKDWRDDPKTEFWVAGREGDGWLNARNPFYITGDTTPMEYGVGAIAVQQPGAMDFPAMTAYVLEREERFNQHGADLLQRVQDRRQQSDGASQDHNMMDMHKQ